jgi:hypothetical protein
VTATATGVRRPDRLPAARGLRRSWGARPQPDDVKKAEAAGLDAHLAKPADPERIAELVG